MGSIEMVRKEMPSAAASAAASLREWSEEKREGMDTPSTLAGPSARAARQATTAESMPPESPTRAPEKPQRRA